MKIYNHFINGEWVEPIKNKYFDTENPFTGEVWAKVARGCEKDADQAVKRQKQHLTVVPGRTCGQRKEVSFW